MEADEIWGYRARSVDKLTPVRVIRHGTKRPARVLVRFEDPALEGREEWVPPSRLKVLWDQTGAFYANEAKWKAVCDLSPRGDTHETEAAYEVFETVLGDEIAELDWRDHYLVVRDVHMLSARSGIPVEEFIEDPVGFEDDGKWIVSWPLALRTSRALAARSPARILAAVENEERKYQYEAIHGRHHHGRRGREGWSVEPELVRELDDEHYRPRRELLREWCGADAVSRWDELVELRKEIKRVGDVAEAAIKVLRSNGHSAAADRLAHDLGQTVEMLRFDPDAR